MCSDIETYEIVGKMFGIYNSGNHKMSDKRKKRYDNDDNTK